jgi:hypothetical protein
MKRPIETALWCDCETDEERLAFISSGRAWETGIISKELIPQIAGIYLELIRLRTEKAEVLVQHYGGWPRKPLVKEFLLKHNQVEQTDKIGTIQPITERTEIPGRDPHDCDYVERFVGLKVTVKREGNK